MTAIKSQARQLFRARDADVEWGFWVCSDDVWIITRNGKRIVRGTADRRSLEHGIEQFAVLTHSAPPSLPCDPVVLAHLKRLEIVSGAAPAAAPTARPRRAKLQGVR